MECDFQMTNCSELKQTDEPKPSERKDSNESSQFVVVI
jgi:hypothetical protein